LNPNLSQGDSRGPGPQPLHRVTRSSERVVAAAQALWPLAVALVLLRRSSSQGAV